MAVKVPINFYANVDEAASEFKKLTTVFKALGAAFAVNKIIDGFGVLINAAAEAEEATNSMRTALKVAGDFSERNAAQFKDLADQIERNTKFDGDLVLSQVAVAKQFGATNQQAEKMIKAAVQLSAATGDDLRTSMRNLGQTLDGTAGQLNELIPGMRQLTSEQLRAGEASELILRLYGGSAEAQLETFNGALIQTKNSFGSLAEALGDVIVSNPAVVDAIKSVTEILEILKESVEENKLGMQEFVRGGIQLAVDGFGIFVQMLAAVDKGVSKVVQGYRVLTGNFKDFEKSVDAEQTRAEVYDRITESAAELSVRLQAASEAQVEISETAEETAKGFDNQVTKIRSVNNELVKQYKTLTDSVRAVGETQADSIAKNYALQVDLVRRALKQRIVSETEAQTTLKNLTLKFDQEIAEARKKERDERLASEQEFLNRLRELASNPIKFVFGSNEINTQGLSRNVREGLSAGIGSISSVLGGKEGARNLIGGFAEAAGQAFFGVPGLGELAKVLSQGPEQVRALVKEFAQALPVLIEGLILAIPVLIEELALAVPQIIETLADKAPEIITKLVENAPRIAGALALAMPRVAAVLLGRLADGAARFVSQILEGASQFIAKLVESLGEGIRKIFDGLNPFKGGFNPTGGGGFGLGGDKGLLGGGIIPGFLKGGGGGGLRIPVAQADESPVSQSAGTAQIIVQIERREIAKAMVDLNRLGYRLA